MRHVTDVPDWPSVTLVVAMRNEESNIGPCLKSLANQDYPPDKLEVVVYDGESTDSSVAVAAAFAAGRARWAVRPNHQRIQAAAWNSGIEAASGEVVGIVSAHAELGPNYVRSAVEALRRTGADMVGGPTQSIGDTPWGDAIAIAVCTPYGVGGARHRYLTEPEVVDTVFMGVCRRDTWLRFPFDETMVRNQDDEMSYRLLDAGGKIVCDPTIQSLYRARSTLKALWHQYFEYGRWKVRVLKAHPRQMRPRHVAPLGLVTSLVLGTSLGIVSPGARRTVLLEASIYATATVAAAVRYMDHRRPGSAVRLTVVYPILHLAYGLGMIAGLSRLGAVALRTGSRSLSALP
jgi:glycosyltransferase involved in cell wall biosynthesis